jgi:hypothetical protein
MLNEKHGGRSALIRSTEEGYQDRVMKDGVI